MKPINILDMVDDAPPERQSKPVALYSTSGFLKKDPKDFNRNEKLAYIELEFSQRGTEAESEKFVFECRAGLSSKAYQEAKAYGLYIYEARL